MSHGISAIGATRLRLPGFSVRIILRKLVRAAARSCGGGDGIVDGLVFWGDVDTIAENQQAHVEAGADHVAVQVIGIEPGGSALPYWRLLGEALLGKGADG
ncbi:hypothetical protein ABZV31_12055 [Streptomyces sp. NPDC005202]|uniref:hypothetical protein n=1 Tax=Streptomyces sp. NPDC005202 TaxID=3157021 RepID=UPI0033BC11D7